MYANSILHDLCFSPQEHDVIIHAHVEEDLDTLEQTHWKNWKTDASGRVKLKCLESA